MMHMLLVTMDLALPTGRETGPMPEIYQVTVRGILDDKWSDWFNGMDIIVQKTSDGTGFTTLTGLVADQAGLRGIVTKLWDLNLTVISVNRSEAAGLDQGPQPGGKPWENY